MAYGIGSRAKNPSVDSIRSPVIPCDSPVHCILVSLSQNQVCLVWHEFHQKHSSTEHTAAMTTWITVGIECILLVFFKLSRIVNTIHVNPITLCIIVASRTSITILYFKVGEDVASVICLAVLLCFLLPTTARS